MTDKDRNPTVLLTPAALQPTFPHPELTEAQAQQVSRYLSHWQTKGERLPTSFGLTLFLRPAPNNPGPE